MTNALCEKLLCNDHCVVIDFETTGIHAQTSEVLQVSMINGRGETLLNTYCKPETVRDWRDAQAIHGIGADDVKDCKPFREYVGIVHKALADADYILAYNAPFEKSFLQKYGMFYAKPLYDPMLMFAKVKREWNAYHRDFKWQKLSVAAAHYGYDFNAHDALEDVKATLFVWRRMLAAGVMPIEV